MTNADAVRAEWHRLCEEYPELLDCEFVIDDELCFNLGNTQFHEAPDCVRVRVAEWLVNASVDVAINTLRHEAAHALAGHAAAHGPEWHAKAVELGMQEDTDEIEAVCLSAPVLYDPEIEYIGLCSCRDHKRPDAPLRLFHCTRCKGPIKWASTRQLVEEAHKTER